MTRDETWLLEEKYCNNLQGLALQEFEADKARLALGEPVAYVIGWQPFLGLAIYLDSKPLIPRTETEWWVGEVGSEIEGRLGSRRTERQQIFSKKLCVSREFATDFSALDLCAGSGAIGCALLAKFPTARVSFGELDPAHEATIRKNIRENGLDESRAVIRVGDLFEPFKGEQFDLIIANPPYIPAGRELDASVTSYEPLLALYSGTDGLGLIRRIAAELPIYLARGGEAWIECDSPAANAASKLFEQQGFVTKVMNDQFGAVRVIVISWPY